MICILLLSVTFVMYFIGRNKDIYYYYLFYHSLCWCSFRRSAGRKPCTWSISHSSQSFCLKTLSTFLRIRAHPSMQSFWISLILFLDVFYHPLQRFIVIIIIITIIIMRELRSEYVQQHRREELNTICQNQRHQLDEALLKQWVSLWRTFLGKDTAISTRELPMQTRWSFQVVSRW